jgi:pSer/pThr/pTyr-binding forkhead associated (FHA) protein
VRDLNSRNGTIVEGQMTATAIVQTFGSFQVGDTIVTVME